MLTVKGVSAYPPLVIFSFLFGFSKGGCCITEVYVVVVGVGRRASRIDPEPVVIVAIDRLK